MPHRIASSHRSLAVLGAAIAAIGVATLLRPIGLDPLLRATSACLAAVMFVGTLAAVRLLPAGRTRATAVAASTLTGLTLLLSGAYLVAPAVIALVGFATRAVHSWRAVRHRTGPRSLHRQSVAPTR